MIVSNISVRELAEFVFRPVDLYRASPGRAIDAEEGVHVQKKIQAQRSKSFADYEKEVALQIAFQFEGKQYQLKGRADGCYSDSNSLIVEEYKCVSVLPATAAPSDWGQALLYIGLMAHRSSVNERSSNPLAGSEPHPLTVNLVYVDADTLHERQFKETFSQEQALAMLGFILQCYAARMSRHLLRTRSRQGYSTDLKFPFKQFRKGQQAAARRVFQGIRNKENLLLEAPTGSGKSLSVLYPAVRSLDEWQQIFFMTARNAGAQAAMQAIKLLDPQSEHLVAVELRAKEKVCPVEGMPCHAELCDRAAGYYQRVEPAITEVLNLKHARTETLTEVATRHQVCPFELSLDAALVADIVVGDYNYVLDPMVRLKRFVGHENIILLTDEAHQLAPRARDMLSVELDRNLVKAVIKSADDILGRGARSIDRTLSKLRREHGDGEHVLAAVPDSVERALRRYIGAVSETQVAQQLTFAGQHGPEDRQSADTAQLLFACTRWLRALEWVKDEDVAIVLYIVKSQVVLTRICLDPADYLRERFAEYGPSVRFSGTLSPLPLFQRLHGGVDKGVDKSSGASQERAQSPFSKDQLAVHIVDDIPTYWRQRTQSLPLLAALIKSSVSTRPGRYLLALSSYAYAEMAAGALAEFRDLQHELFVQEPGMDNTALDRLLSAFRQSDAGILIMVMGGSLGESVDFADTQLSGVFIVGMGLPPPSLNRDLLAVFFEKEASGWGQMVAYSEPALTKILQTAGRLLRSPADRGMIFLIDQRFMSPHIQSFFPPHWQPETTHWQDCAHAVTQYWQTTTEG